MYLKETFWVDSVKTYEFVKFKLEDSIFNLKIPFMLSEMDFIFRICSLKLESPQPTWNYIMHGTAK